MNSAVLRTIQVGVALLVLAAAIIGVLLVLGFLDSAAALALGTNVGSIVLIAVCAALVLIGLFSIGRSSKHPD